jgi:hypothetical protein
VRHGWLTARTDMRPRSLNRRKQPIRRREDDPPPLFERGRGGSERRFGLGRSSRNAIPIEDMKRGTGAAQHKSAWDRLLRTDRNTKRRAAIEALRTCHIGHDINGEKGHSGQTLTPPCLHPLSDAVHLARQLRWSDDTGDFPPPEGHTRSIRDREWRKTPLSTRENRRSRGGSSRGQFNRMNDPPNHQLLRARNIVP